MPLQPSDVRRAYDTFAHDYARTIPDTRAEAALDLAMVDAFVAAVSEHVAGPDVLDAGCGAGRMSRHLDGLGCRMTGVDLSPGMVAQALASRPDLPVIVGSLLALPVPDASVSGVLLWYSTIHLPHERHPQVFAEVRRVLRPGGHVLVGFQAGEGVRDLAPVYARHGHDVVLERYRVRPDDMARVMADAGLVERARVTRQAADAETDDQAILLAQLM